MKSRCVYEYILLMAYHCLLLLKSKRKNIKLCAVIKTTVVNVMEKNAIFRIAYIIRVHLNFQSAHKRTNARRKRFERATPRS